MKVELLFTLVTVAQASAFSPRFRHKAVLDKKYSLSWQPIYASLAPSFSDNTNTNPVINSPKTTNYDLNPISISNNIDYHIVGGTKLGKVPGWMVSLRRPSETDVNVMEHFCGATLIADTWVLTAAHCIDTWSALEYQEHIQVWMDGLNRNNHDEFDKFNVTNFVVHPDWSEITGANDIALLKLDRNATKSDNNVCGPRRPITLRKEFEIPVNEYLEIIGWGVLEEIDNEMATIIRTAMVPVISNEKCNTMYLNGITSGHFCAGFIRGKIDACSGDSGGPIFLREMNMFDVQYGIISWGVGCARVKQYGVYTRVANYITWIVNNGVNLYYRPPSLPSGLISNGYGLTDFFLTTVTIPDTKVEPITYVGFKCGFTCPERKVFASFKDSQSPLACIQGDPGVVDNVPTSVIANISVTIVKSNMVYSAVVDLIKDPAVVCRPARELCREVEFNTVDGSTCKPPLSGPMPSTTICRINLRDIFPNLPITKIILPNVTAVVVYDGNTTLKNIAEEVKMTPAVLWGTWKNRHSIIWTDIKGKLGLPKQPIVTTASMDISTIRVAEINQAAGMLSGTFVDVGNVAIDKDTRSTSYPNSRKSTVRSKQDLTTTVVNAGQFWCITSTLDNVSTESYDCTFVIHIVQTNPQTTTSFSSIQPNASSTQTSAFQNLIEKVTMSISHLSDYTHILSVSRNTKVSNSEGTFKITLSFSTYTHL